MKRIQIAIIAVALVIAVQARASLFDITFSDNDGANVGNGVLTATDNGNGTWNVTAATFQMTAGTLVGSYTLVPNPNAPNPNVLDGFVYDNQASYPAIPYLDTNGLLFSGPAVINLWGNSPTDYELFSYTPSVDTHGIVTLTPVPEASTMIAGALLLLPFGASTLRILRRNRTA
jgi:hypothetical protein